MSNALPIATSAQVKAEAGRLLHARRGSVAGSLFLHIGAALAGLAGPLLVGSLVDAVTEGTTTARVDVLAGLLAGFVLVQTVLTGAARKASFVIGEGVFADLRETFMQRVLALPLSTVERAGTGDLVSRTTGDVDTMARTVRFAVPETVVALITTVLTVTAALLASPQVAVVGVAGVAACSSAVAISSSRAVLDTRATRPVERRASCERTRESRASVGR